MRELHAKGRGRYNAYQAHCRALERVKDRGKRERLKNETTRVYANEKLRIGWSPEQISIRIGIDRGKDFTISPEAIYQFIYAQVHRSGNGLVKKGCEDLRPYLARRHTVPSDQITLRNLLNNRDCPPYLKVPDPII